MGTNRNCLQFLVKNPNFAPLKKISVVIRSSPDWIKFESSIFKIDSVPAKEKREAQFFFDVSNGEANRNESVQLDVCDEHNQILVQRVIAFQTAMQWDKTKPFPP